MHSLYTALVTSLCRKAVARPLLWLAGVVLLSLPTLTEVAKINVDTDLIRLLPRTSRASVLTTELEDVVSDGGYFSVALEHEDRGRLLEALEYVAATVGRLDEVQSVQYTWPIEFIKEYRYLLIPTDYLERIYWQLIDWEAEVSPFVERLDDVGEETFGDEEDRRDMEIALQRYQSLSQYHESENGEVMGMLVRTSGGVTGVDEIKAVFAKLEEITSAAAEKFGVWAGIAGSHRNKLDDLKLILTDVSRSGLIGGALIFLVLLVSFRSLPVVMVVLWPLATGLLWAFALIPRTIGDLNLITAFILVILFGMGVDYSIHLVKRFQTELAVGDLEEALRATYLSTGASVIVSGLTTALALSLLAVSDFRGFSEFGIIGAISIVMMLLAMFVALPPALVVGFRAGIFGGKGALRRRRPPFIAGRKLTASLLVLMVGLSAVALSSLGFEYNLNNLQYEKARRSPGARETKVRLKKIYSGSISPGAVYLADDLAAVDRFTALLEKAKKEEGSSIGRVRSLRDYAPSASGKEERLMLIEDIKDQLEGKWTRRIEDEGQQELIEDFRRWEVPTSTPLVEEIPGEIRKTLQAKDDSGRFLVTVHPNVDRSDGRNAMAFAEDLYELEEMPGIVGPIGETVVFAEILWIVTSESGWLVALTLAGVFLIVWLNRRSLRDTLWILLPLAAAVSASLGLCALFGFKLNFFNIVVIPALLGMGVDGGVHYYRRWAESGRDVAATQAELFEPLSTAIGTTMIGYSGMIFAGHNGIRSIGIFACLGLSLVWVATLVLLPGMLDWFGGKK